MTPLPGGGSQTISGDLLADFIPGTGSIAVSASPLARSTRRLCSRRCNAIHTAAPSRRSASPCRCSTSIASPRSNISASTPISTGGSTRRSSANSAARARAAPSECGASDNNDEDVWLDAFVTDFDPRAGAQFRGLEPSVRPGARQAAQRGRQHAGAEQGQFAAVAYALYVLARNGRPVIGDLRYLTDAKLDAFTSPLAQGSACRRVRDARRSELAPAARLRRRAQGARRRARRKASRGPIRLAAARRRGVLALVAEAKLGNVEGDAVARAGAVLEQARARAFLLSTQEMNWMTLAAEALAEHAVLAQFSVNGEAVKGALYRRWSGPTSPDKRSSSPMPGKIQPQLVVDGFWCADRARPGRRPRLCN